MKKAGNILLFVFGIILSAYAQTPNRLSYQAVVRNGAGALVTNGPVGIKISILKESVTGAIAYAETQTITTNANGLLSLQIGGGTLVSGNLNNIKWGESLHFLKTEIDPAGGSNYVVSGVSQMLSVPYALYAQQAGGLQNTSEIQLSDSASGSKITLTAPSAGGSTGGLGTSTSHGLYFYSKNVDRMILDTNGRLGLGTFTPSSLLHLNGVNTEIRLQNTASNLYITAPDNNSTGGIGTSSNHGLYFFTNNADRALISNNGNLGIGAFDANVQPPSRITVKDGDVYLQDNTKGIILKSPNNSCWRVTVDNTGNLVRTSITCPQ